MDARRRDHDELRIRGIAIDERKFNPAQPRDRRGRWTLTGAMIALLKSQGGEQGGAYFDGDSGDSDYSGRYVDWSRYNAKTGEYTLEFSDGEDYAQFSVTDNDLEQLFNALTVTRLRDAAPKGEPNDEHSANVAALSALGHADHLVLDDETYIDWSTRTDDGDYGFGIGDADGNEVAFDLTPAELQKLIASLALSTQAPGV